MALASCTRCCMPPERSAGRWSMRLSGNSEASSASRALDRSTSKLRSPAISSRSATLPLERVLHQQPQMRVLVDDADMAGAQHALLVALHLEQVAVVAIGQAQAVVAAIGDFLEVHGAQQRRLARAAFADNAQHLAGIDGDIDALQRHHLAVAPADAAHGDDGRRVEQLRRQQRQMRQARFRAHR